MRSFSTHRRLIIPLGALGLLASVAEAYTGTLDTTNAFTWDGLNRNYCLYEPQGLTGSYPLVFLVHGGSSSCADLLDPNKQRPFKAWLDIADREKFVIVAPDGWDSGNGKMWNDCREDCTECSIEDDLGFVNALIDQVDLTYNIDLTRVYATGESNGGHMSYRLAMEKADRFAAVAPVIANMAAHNKCQGPVQPVPVSIMNGTEDPKNPFNGGQMDNATRGWVLSAANSTSFWVDHNNCSTPPSAGTYQDVDLNDGDGSPQSSTVSYDSYTGCDESGEVKLFTVTGGGHVLPSIAHQITNLGELVLGQQNHDVEGAEEIWAFFSGKTLGTAGSGTCVAGNTGYLSPSAEAADTGGDNNGFESNPTRAYADGSPGHAANVNGAGDRHRYYDYGISIPAGCVVKGIQVRMDWWLDSNTGTNSQSIELSWNGGTSWTSPKTDTQETTTEHIGYFGDLMDTWGRSWAASDLSNTSFRVRVKSNSTASGRDFFLDWIPVKVYYGP